MRHMRNKRNRNSKVRNVKGNMISKKFEKRKFAQEIKNIKGSNRMEECVLPTSKDKHKSAIIKPILLKFSDYKK